MKKNHTVWLVTIGFILIFIILAILKCEEFLSLTFVEIISIIGDYSTVLAFVWLIHGYQMQAKDIETQANDLKSQVESTKKMLELTKQGVESNLELIKFEKNKFDKEFINSIRPIIVFYNTGKDEHGVRKWVMKNVGTSPAINITVSCSDDGENWVEKDTALFSALGPNETKTLNWTTKHRALVTIYSDIENNEYSTLCKGNKNNISRGIIVPNLRPHIFEHHLKQTDM